MTLTDPDYRRGYTIAAGGKITLLKPLSESALSNLIDHHPKQLSDLRVQQIELELKTPPQPDQRSRQSQTPNGYIHLVAWSNACLLRILMTAWFRRYRGIYGYNKGFYPASTLATPVAYSHASWRRDYGAGRNLQDFTGPLTSPKSPLNSPNFASPPNPSLNPPKFPLNSPNFDYSSSFSLNTPKSPVNSFIPAWLNPKLLDRLEAQLLDALRSTIANIEEGYGRPTTIEYLNFLGYTQASLKEAKGDVQRMKQDGLLASKPGSKLADLGIDLAAWHAALKRSVISRPPPSPLTSPKSPLNFPKGTYGNLKDFTGEKSPGEAGPPPLTSPKSPLNSFNFNYPPVDNFDLDETPRNSPLNTPKSPVNSYNFGYAPVDNFDPSQLTCEMLIELINKTDWNLRQLVGSLESKLDADQKSYQIDRARIRGKLNWRK